MEVNSQLVGQLARLEPRDSATTRHAASAFPQLHTNPAFGWRIARAFARARLPLPVTVIGRDHWLFRAYLAFLNPRAYRSSNVEAAHHLSQQPTTSAMLKAMLIAGLGEPIDAHLTLVAEKAGIPRRTLEAFEILFFNVLDRPKDGLYLSEIVYPGGREVELVDDYFRSAPIADLLIRVGYNHRDFDLVAHLSGLDDASFVTALAKLKDRETELEKQFMGNALVMARSGLLNQRSVGMQRAMTLLTASRSARSQTETVTCPPDYDLAAELAAALAAVPPITETDIQEARAASRPGRSYWSDDDGNITAFDDNDDTDDAPAPPPAATPCEPIMHFPEPRAALWRNRDCDQPVSLVARMSAPGLPDHYLTDGNIGIPASEVFFEN